MFDLSLFLRSVTEDPANHLSPEQAILPSSTGIRFFDTPLVGIASAGDPLFQSLCQPGVIGPWFRLPAQWLPEARSVLSFFFPFTDRVRQAEDFSSPFPAPDTLNARYEGQQYLKVFIRRLRDALLTVGESAVIPSDDETFWSVWNPGSQKQATTPEVSFTSTWSERHVAYVCGLGTFGLSANLITAKGCNGRLCSLVTSAEFAPTPRAYDGPFSYCTRCGLCAAHCPVGAIDPVTGKTHPRCAAWIQEVRHCFEPRYCCVRCQLRLPCTAGIPELL